MGILTYDPGVSSLPAGFQIPGESVPGTLTIKLEENERDAFVEVDYLEANKQAKLIEAQPMNVRRAARHKMDMAKARRRMATREFSSRRDSPVMVRLLQEIVAANEAFQPSGRRRRLPWGRSRFGAALGQLGSAVTQVTTP